MQILGVYDPRDMIAGLGFLGIIIITFLIVVAILWFLLPFAVFGIKDHLRHLTTQLEEVRNELQKIAALLDPDDEKSKLHAAYVKKEEEKQLAKELRQQQLEEMEKEEKRKRKEAEKEQRKMEKEREKEMKRLSNNQASVNCPTCNQLITIKDLRSGTKHLCPRCNQEFVIS